LVCRQSIIAEVENSLAAQYAAMPQEELHQWHATLQQGLSESSDAHHKAKDYLKQVGRSHLVTNVLRCHTCAGNARCLMSHEQLATNVLRCHTCAGSTRCLMSHNSFTP